VISASIVIPRRFNGPHHSGNGGYVCGRIAQYLSGPVKVRLRSPPPLEQELRVEASDDEAHLFDGNRLIAEAQRVDFRMDPPAAPTFAQAHAASKAYVGFKRHLLPTCFVCGPQRAEGDGMRIFPGPTAHDAVLAAPWTPHESLADASGRVPPEFLWAALDCAGAFSIMPPEDKLILLGELCARLDGAVEVGERCVVVAWPLGGEGRKRFAGTAILSASGAPVAMARATWIEIPAARSDSSGHDGSV
jgi:hypothetical protein